MHNSAILQRLLNVEVYLPESSSLCRRIMSYYSPHAILLFYERGLPNPRQLIYTLGQPGSRILAKTHREEQVGKV